MPCCRFLNKHRCPWPLQVDAFNVRPEGEARNHFLVRSLELGVDTQRGLWQTAEALDPRRRPRFKLEVDMRIYPRDCPVVQGHSVDISESGISAMLRLEVPVGGVVRLEFTLSLGEVEVLAVVRHRNAFRYGFQFVEISSGQDVIARTCRQLAVEQSTR